MSTSSRPLRFLTAPQIMRLYQTHVTRTCPSQSSMLESAVSSPQNHNRYGQTDVFQLAGILAERIMKNHSYQDGNKRAALLAADVFLKSNGFQLQKKELLARDLINDGLTNAHIAVASNQWNAENLAAYYQSVASPVETSASMILEVK